MAKYGFFGGSFNPPTIAHLKIVETSIKEFGLDKLVIVPMGDKYEKSELISFDLRFKMLEKTFEGNNKVEISRMQENQVKRTDAIDSFKEIENIYKDTENFFIMGLDNYSNIYKWKNSEELLKNYKYIVFKRDMIKIPEYARNVHFFDVSLDISSSKARQMIKSNENLENVLSKNVIDFIKENNLYK